MRLRKLLVNAVAVSMCVCSVCGCGNKKSDTVANNATTQATTQAVEEVTVNTTEAVTEEMTTAVSNGESTVKQEDIILVNPFMVYCAELEGTAQIPATPEIEFDSNVELSIYQLTLVEIGKTSADMGYLKLEDVFKAGLVGSNGETVFKEETSGWMDVYTKDLSVAVYDHNDETNPYVAELHIDENYHDEGKGYSDIPVKITEFGLCPGQSVDVLKPFGMPSYTMCLEGKYYYYWQIETEEKVACVEVVTSEGVIERLATAVY